MKRWLLIIVGAIVAIGAIWSLTGKPALGVPTGPPLLKGTITRRTGQIILVETDPTVGAGSPKCVLRYSAKTVVLRQTDGKTMQLSADELIDGRVVSVWTNGPVQESYPCEGNADIVLIWS